MAAHSYGAVQPYELDTSERAGTRGHNTAAVAAVAALALVAAVVLAGAAMAGYAASAPVSLADPGYLKWLKTLNGPVDYQTGKEYDDRFDSESMPHMDITHLVPSALPGMKKVGMMQGAGRSEEDCRRAQQARPRVHCGTRRTARPSGSGGPARLPRSDRGPGPKGTDRPQGPDGGNGRARGSGSHWTNRRRGR